MQKNKNNQKNFSAHYLFNFSSERGVTLTLTMILLANILMIALVVGVFSLGQQEVMTNTRNSVYAIFAATSGLERALYDIRIKTPDECATLSSTGLLVYLDNGSAYYIYANPCDATSSSVTSKGAFRSVTRTVEASW